MPRIRKGRLTNRFHFIRHAASLASGAVLSMVVCTLASAQAPSVQCVSIGCGAGSAPSGAYLDPAISGDGVYVAYTSGDATLASCAGIADGNGANDVFVRQRSTSLLEVISVSQSGSTTADAESKISGASISQDGNYIVFVSQASDLVTNPTNNQFQVFRRDRTNHLTELVSVNPSGSGGDGMSSSTSISGDGVFVAFESAAKDLVAGDSNGMNDCFVRNMTTGVTVRVSLDVHGLQVMNHSQNPRLSRDGTHVVFSSRPNSLDPMLPTNGSEEVYLVDLTQSSPLEMISVDNTGTPAKDTSRQASVSANGAFVSFDSIADNLVPTDMNKKFDVFVRDVAAKRTVVLSELAGTAGTAGPTCSGDSSSSRISPDGRFVAFYSDAADLCPADSDGNTDIVLVDRDGNGDGVLDPDETPSVHLVSITSAGVSGNNSSNFASLFELTMSDDGRFVAFTSDASDLVANDTDGAFDAFVFDEGSGAPSIYCTAKVNSQGCLPTISFSGAPSYLNSGPFNVKATNVINNKNGLAFYGISATGVAFEGGFLCVKLPVSRTPVQNSQGNPPPNDCSGAFDVDLNPLIAAPGNSLHFLGVEGFVQYWYRDPASPSTTGLTDALRFRVGP